MGKGGLSVMKNNTASDAEWLPSSDLGKLFNLSASTIVAIAKANKFQHITVKRLHCYSRQSFSAYFEENALTVTELAKKLKKAKETLYSFLEEDNIQPTIKKRLKNGQYANGYYPSYFKHRFDKWRLNRSLLPKETRLCSD